MSVTTMERQVERGAMSTKRMNGRERKRRDLLSRAERMQRAAARESNPVRAARMERVAMGLEREAQRIRR